MLDKGVIVERGTHEALLARGGVYAALWSRQREVDAAEETLAAGRRRAGRGRSGRPRTSFDLPGVDLADRAVTSRAFGAMSAPRFRQSGSVS